MASKITPLAGLALPERRNEISRLYKDARNGKGVKVYKLSVHHYKVGSPIQPAIHGSQHAWHYTALMQFLHPLKDISYSTTGPHALKRLLKSQTHRGVRAHMTGVKL